MTIRGKRPIPVFRLIKSLPARKFCTPKVPIELHIPRGWEDAAGYIAHFSLINNFKPSSFLIEGKEVIA